MEKVVSASEANQRFSRLLRDAENGDTIVITRRGVPRWKLQRLDDDAQARAERIKALVEKMRARPITYTGRWTREELYEDE